VTLARAGEDGQQTRLRLIHTGLAGDLGLLHDDGWTRFLAHLASVTAGGEPPAYPSRAAGRAAHHLARPACQERQPMKPEGAVAVDVLTEIVIGRPAGVVAGYAADPSNAPAWYRNITSVTWETSPPLQTGSRMTFSAASSAGISPTPTR
jgi:hypothetical protein